MSLPYFLPPWEPSTPLSLRTQVLENDNDRRPRPKIIIDWFQPCYKKEHNINQENANTTNAG